MPMTVSDLHRSPLTSDETFGYDGVLLVVSRRPNGPSSLTDVASNPASTEASFADSWRLGDANRTVWSLDSRRSGILQSFALLSANLLASEAVQLGGRSTSTDPFIDPGQRQLYVDQGKAENPAWPHVLVHLSREVDKHEQGCATMVESVSHFVGEGKSWPRRTRTNLSHATVSKISPNGLLPEGSDAPHLLSPSCGQRSCHVVLFIYKR